MIKEGYEVPYFEVDSLGFYLEMFEELGCIDIGPEGIPLPLSFTEIRSYLLSVWPNFEAYDAVLLKDMSKAYVSGLNEGKDPYSIPPDERKTYESVVNQEDE